MNQLRKGDLMLNPITFCTMWMLLQLFVSVVLAQTETPVEDRTSVPADINKAFLDPELKAEEWTERFEVESREIFVHRNDIVAAVGLESGSQIADVGSGTGLFIQPFSAAVTNSGEVFALDISPRLIEHIKQRVEREGLENVDVLLSKEDSISLPFESVDIVFTCATYHHFEYYDEMLRSIRFSLRPGGELIIVDFQRIEGVTREWVLGHVRAGKERVRGEIEKAGFEFVEEVEVPGLEENYFLRFKKP